MFLEAFSQVLILHFIVFCLLFYKHYIYLYIKKNHNSMKCIMIAVPVGRGDGGVCCVERMVLLFKSRCYGNPTLNPVSHVCWRSARPCWGFHDLWKDLQDPGELLYSCLQFIIARIPRLKSPKETGA